MFNSHIYEYSLHDSPIKQIFQNTLIKTVQFHKLAFFQNKNTHCFLRERFGIKIFIPLDPFPSPRVLD